MSYDVDATKRKDVGKRERFFFFEILLPSMPRQNNCGAPTPILFPGAVIPDTFALLVSFRMVYPPQPAGMTEEEMNPIGVKNIKNRGSDTN